MTESEQKTRRGKTAPSLSKNEMEYLLKELELHVQAENASRDNAEQVIQSFLTTITAITGAVLLVTQYVSEFTVSIISVFLGSIAIFGFSVFTFFRMVSSRQGLSILRYRLFLIRKLLQVKGKFQSVDVIFSQSKYLEIGFSPRVINFFLLFSIFCGAIFSTALTTGIVTYLHITGKILFESSLYYLVLYGLPNFLCFLLCLIILMTTVRKGKQNAQGVWQDLDFALNKFTSPEVSKVETNGK
jgi:hypothetical protein